MGVMTCASWNVQDVRSRSAWSSETYNNGFPRCAWLKMSSKTSNLCSWCFFLPPILTSTCSSKIAFPPIFERWKCENYIKIIETHRLARHLVGKYIKPWWAVSLPQYHRVDCFCPQLSTLKTPPRCGKEGAATSEGNCLIDEKKHELGVIIRIDQP